MVRLKEGGRVGPGTFYNLVFQLQNKPLGTLEADSLDTFDPVYILCQDGLADFFGAERGQHHASRSHADPRHPDKQAEKLSLVFGGKAIEELFVFPDVVMNICHNLGLQLKGLVGLQGNKETVSDSVILQDKLCGR